MNFLCKNHPYDRYHRKHRLNKKRKLDELLKDIERKAGDSDSDDSEFEDEFGFDDDDVSCKDNRIYFKCKVTEDTIEKLIKLIESKNKKFKKISTHKMIKSAVPKPLYLHITSYGGDLLACFRAIDAIKRSEIPIHTVVDGYAASAGTLMSVVGKKRYMTPSSYMLIHQLTSNSMGKYWEIKDDNENVDTWMNDIYKLYVENTKMTLEQLKTFLAHDFKS